MSIKNIMHAALNTPSERGWSLPILAEGPPGGGKTATAQQLGAEYGVHTEIFSPGERGEAALGVISVPVEIDGERYLEACSPAWGRNFQQGDDEVGILCIDELKNTASALRPPLLGLALRGVLGEKRFGPRVRILSLTNPADQCAFGSDLDPALANRFVHLTWDAPSVDEWAIFNSSIDAFGDGAVEKGSFDLKEHEEFVMKEWERYAWSRALAITTGFLKSKPESLHVCPELNDPQASKAWPSHRTWSYATRALASSFIHDLSQTDRETFVSGCVGHVAANDLWLWQEKADLPDIAELLDGNVSFEYSNLAVDKTAAVLSGCAALLVPKNAEKRSARGDAFYRFCADLVAQGCPKDLLCPAVIAVLSPSHGVPILTPSAAPLFTSLGDMLSAAGIKAQS